MKIPMEVAPIEKTKGFILAQFDNNGKKVISLKRERRYNPNICVIGSSGSDKYMGYGYMTILQAVKMGESVVVAYVTGEYYQKLSQGLIERGIAVKFFSLGTVGDDDSWAHDGGKELSLPGEQQCVYFVTLSSQPTSTKASFSSFFDLLLANLINAVIEQGVDNRIPVNIILDEICDFEKIPDLDAKIAVTKSRKINISILLSSVSRFQFLYGTTTAMNILSQFGTTLFLGSGDPETCQYIVELDCEKQISEASIRQLFFTECLVFIRGHRVIKAKKIWGIQHPDASPR